jgi:hypothetical protein
MAGRGPAPKPSEQRRRRNTDPVSPTVLTNDGQKIGPTLKKLTGRDWSDQTNAWFDTWRAAPQSRAFIGTDWLRLGLLAGIVERYWSEPSASLLAEIRLNEERLGGTIVDRQRARMVIETEGDAAPVLSLAESREQIAKRLRK